MTEIKITDNKTFREWFYFYIKTIEMTKEEGINFLSEITKYPKSFFDYLLKSNQNVSEEIYKKLDYLLNNVDRFVSTNQQTCNFYKINPQNLEKTKEQLKTKQIKLIEIFEPTKKNTPAGDLLNKVQAQIKINMEKLQND